MSFLIEAKMHRKEKQENIFFLYHIYHTMRELDLVNGHET